MLWCEVPRYVKIEKDTQINQERQKELKNYMKKKIDFPRFYMACTVFLTLIFVMLFCSVSWAAEQTVKVAFFEGEHFLTEDDNGHKQGYAYDYLQAISYYTNWKYEYVYGTWTELLEQFYRGEIDLMPGLSKTADREEKALFPGYPMGVESYYIYAHADDPLAQLRGSAFDGHVIGVNRYSYQYDLLKKWIREEAPGAQIRLFDGNESRQAAFTSGETQETVTTALNINYGMNMVPVRWIGGSDYYLAVSKNRPDLLEKLDSALGEIVAIKPNFTNQLMEKYFQGNAVSMSLSREENRYITEHPVLRIGYFANYLPFSGKDPDGNVQGVITDIVSKMLHFLGIERRVTPVYISYDSMDAMLKALKNGEIQVMFPCENDVTIAEEEEVFLTSELIRVPMFMIFRGEYQEDMVKRIAVVRGNNFQKRLSERLYPDAEAVECESTDEGFRIVEAGDADVMLVNETVKDAYFSKVRNRVLNTFPLPENRTICMAVNRGEIPLYSLLERGIAALPKNFVITSTYEYIGASSSFDIDNFIHEHIYTIFIVTILTAVLVIGSISYLIMSRREKAAYDRMAHTDNMTGLWNRRAYDEDMERVEKKDLPADAVYISADLNELKHCNDTLGHEAGDEMIRAAADGLKEFLNPYGKVYRIGGDEFAAMVRIPRERQTEILEALSQVKKDWTGSGGQRVSLSLGVVAGDEIRKLTLHEIIAEADQRMYDNKAAYYQQTGHDRRK